MFLIRNIDTNTINLFTYTNNNYTSIVESNGAFGFGLTNIFSGIVKTVSTVINVVNQTSKIINNVKSSLNSIFGSSSTVTDISAGKSSSSYNVENKLITAKSETKVFHVSDKQENKKIININKQIDTTGSFYGDIQVGNYHNGIELSDDGINKTFGFDINDKTFDIGVVITPNFQIGFKTSIVDEFEKDGQKFIIEHSGISTVNIGIFALGYGTILIFGKALEHIVDFGTTVVQAFTY